VREQVAPDWGSMIEVTLPVVVVIDRHDESVLNIRSPPIGFLHQSIEGVTSFQPHVMRT
jgi:hypothetical protein